MGDIYQPLNIKIDKKIQMIQKNPNKNPTLVTSARFAISHINTVRDFIDIKSDVLSMKALI